MPVTRADVVSEARSWIGTPFHHQATLKGVGVDCGGLIRGVMINCGLAPPDVLQWEGIDKFVGYSRQPDGTTFIEACNYFLIPTKKYTVADVVVFAIDAFAQHAGIVGDYRHGGLSLIHAMSRNDGVGSVIETRLVFASNLKFVAAYQLPGVT